MTPKNDDLWPLLECMCIHVHVPTDMHMHTQNICSSTTHILYFNFPFPYLSLSLSLSLCAPTSKHSCIQQCINWYKIMFLNTVVFYTKLQSHFNALCICYSQFVFT